MEGLIGQLGSDVKSRKLPEAQMLNSCHLRFSSRTLYRGASSDSDEDEQPSLAPKARQRLFGTRGRAEEGVAEVLKVVPEFEGRVVGRRERSLIVDWAVNDQGLLEKNVWQAKVLRKDIIRRGESTIKVESRTHFDRRKSSSSSARQRCHVASHFPKATSLRVRQEATRRLG